MDKNKGELTLPTLDEILGVNEYLLPDGKWSVNSNFGIYEKSRLNCEKQLDVLRKYGSPAAVTDLVSLITYGNITCENTVPDDNTLKGRTGIYYTRTSADAWSIRSIKGNGYESDSYEVDQRRIAIRPVLILPPNEFDQIYQNSVIGYNGIREVEYGEYPQYAPNAEMQRILENEYEKGNLTKTGRNYTFDKNYKDWNAFEPKYFEEYIYQGRGYIRFKDMAPKVIQGNIMGCELSNGMIYSIDDYVWVEVLPVVWLIDEKTKKLISKRSLMAGIRFYGAGKHGVEFLKTEIKKFLDKYMLNDLTQPLTYIRSKENTIENIIKEIIIYLDRIPDSEKVKNNLTSLVNEYNLKIIKLKELNEKNIPSIESLESITYNLKIKLNMILDDLRKYSVTFKEYYNMLDTIDRYIATIIGENKNIYDDFSKDLKTIVDICIPFLKETEGNIIKNQLLEALQNQKQEIINYLHNTSEVNNHSNNNHLKYKTVDEMILELREKIHPILEQLNISVNKRDLELEISENIKEIIEGIYEKPKNKLIAIYLDEINSKYQEIMTKIVELPEYLQNQYKIEINKTMEIDDNVDYSITNITSATKNLSDMILSLNRVLFKIDNYLDKKQQFNNSYIDLNKYNK